MSEAEAASVTGEIMEGLATPAQIAAFLVALRLKGETAEEITGMAMTMRDKADRVELDAHPLVDTCGTGGDCSNTFNISTVSAFITAGAGILVAKHGNRSVSSSCGSADVLKAAGVDIELSVDAAKIVFKKAGIVFLFAPLFHKAMKHAIGPRKEIGIRTVFNILGPLANPAGADVQVIGVYDAKLTEKVARVLANLGCRRAAVVHGSGLDEITTTGSTSVSEVENSTVRNYVIEPELFGIKRVNPEALKGGGPEENAVIMRAVLSGEKGPKRDIAALNAAMAIYLAGAANSLSAGLAAAYRSIDSGAALAKLEELKKASMNKQGAA